jgi:divalent metal cation (Fe/Co/Zn/Cd) transporter
MHLEVNESLTVDEAHEQAATFETLIRQAIPQIQRIITHIEPLGNASATHQAIAADEEQVRQALRKLRPSLGIKFEPHDVFVRRDGGGDLVVSFHCTMDGNEAITDAHTVTEQVERSLRSQIPNLGRVVIHVEPSNNREK